MAHQHESAGNSVAPGSAPTAGTSSLDPARDACSDEAFFIGSSAEALSVLVGQFSRLSPQLEIAMELIHAGRGTPDGPAGALLDVARGRLIQLTEDLERLADSAERQAQKRGCSHG